MKSNLRGPKHDQYGHGSQWGQVSRNDQWHRQQSRCSLNHWLLPCLLRTIRGVIFDPLPGHFCEVFSQFTSGLVERAKKMLKLATVRSSLFIIPTNSTGPVPPPTAAIQLGLLLLAGFPGAVRCYAYFAVVESVGGRK